MLLFTFEGMLLNMPKFNVFMLVDYLPFVAVDDSPDMFLECFLVCEVFFSSGSYVMWYVLLRSQFDGLVVELS